MRAAGFFAVVAACCRQPVLADPFTSNVGSINSSPAQQEKQQQQQQQQQQEEQQQEPRRDLSSPFPVSSSFKVYGSAGEHKHNHSENKPSIIDVGVGGGAHTGIPHLARPREATKTPGDDAITTTTTATTTTTETTERRLSFTATNEYLPITTSPWPHIAEPFRKTTFTAESTIGDDADADLYMWSFPDGSVLEGRVVTHMFTILGKQNVTLTQTVLATGTTFPLRAQVMVKYVRREIRQLTKEDRNAFFDAMETLFRLPTSVGRKLYGDDYKGINFFVQMHLDGAGTKECDHWHDDAGIMTHHVGYTLQFEQAMQLVDPSVSIPYWEYTIEASEGLSAYGKSEVFGDDWFGNASPDNAMHTVDKGRWAYLPVKEKANDFVHNAYGLLRTPWNVDGTPFVTRHDMTNSESSTSMVSCAAYSMCFSSSSLTTMNNCLNGGTHGPVHILVGGEWDDPEEDFIVQTGYSDRVPLITKYLWRKGYLRTPKSCSAEEDGIGDTSTCRSSCPADLYESRNMTAYDVLVDVNALFWISAVSKGKLEYEEEGDRYVVAGHRDDEEFQQAFFKKMLHSLCDPGHTGELYTSSAPYDPLFWVIHPSAERFLSWRRKLGRELVDESYRFDETWGYDHGSVVGETGVVCDWSNVEDDSLDMPTCVKGICGGHNADDMLPFKVKINGEIRKMTNTEWLDFIYPDNEELPYIYNEYRWDHCAAEGYDMGTL